MPPDLAVALSPHPATPEHPSSQVPSSLHTIWTTLRPLAQPLPCLPFSYDFTEDLGQQLLFVQTEAFCVDLLEDCWGRGAERASILYTWGNDACYVTASTRHIPTPHALCAKHWLGNLSCCGVSMVSSTWRFMDVAEELQRNLQHWPNIRVSQNIVLGHTELPGILMENEVPWASDLPESESLREAPRNVHFLTSLPNDFGHHEVREPLLQLHEVFYNVRVWAVRETHILCLTAYIQQHKGGHLESLQYFCIDIFNINWNPKTFKWVQTIIRWKARAHTWGCGGEGLLLPCVHTHS